MDTVGGRLKQYVEGQGYTLNNFAKKFDIHYSGLAQIVRDERALGMNVLMQIKNALPNIDTDWLLFGTVRGDLSNFDKVENQTAINEVSENDALVKKLFLKYLEDSEVREKIKQILKS